MYVATHQVHGRAPGRVGLHEELAGGLAEAPDLVLGGLAHDGALGRGHGLQVHAALVGQVVEHVGGADRLGTCEFTKPRFDKLATICSPASFE